MGRKLKYPTKLLVGFADDLLQAIDAWREKQVDPKPSRSEAIRHILSDYLKVKGFFPK